MAMSINTNSTAITAQRNINSANMRSTSSLAKLSSGSRVPSAKDDVAALAVGTKLRAEVAGLRQAQQNVGQGVSLLQIADGAMNTISDMLTRMKALAVQSTSGQLTDADRTLLNNEYAALGSEVDRVAADTAFNGRTLLAGSTNVSANINDMDEDAGQNLIGEGFESIDFASDYDDGAISIAHTTGGLMTVTNLESGAKQTVDIGTTNVSAGQTETYSFGDIGVSITLNDKFVKTTAIAAVNTSANADIEAGSIAITSVIDTGTGFDFGDLDDGTITFDTTAANAATISATLGGVAFTGAAVDLTALGTATASIADADGNTINFEFNITTAVSDADATVIEMDEFGQIVGAEEVAGSSVAFSFKVGTGTAANDDISVTLSTSDFSTLAGSAIGTVATSGGAATELGKLDTAINQITSNRATVGAAQSRLEFAGASLAVATENTLSAQSAMLDVDVSSEMTEFTSSQVLLQAGISMLAQANQQPALLLRLLQ